MKKLLWGVLAGTALSSGAAFADPASLPPKVSPSAFDAYAADLPVGYKAPPPMLEQRGQFQVWVDGGVFWTGGDPKLDSFGVNGLPNNIFNFNNNSEGFFGRSGTTDFNPKMGWSVGTGFDYRLPNSTWHAQGSVRFFNSGTTSGSAATGASLDQQTIQYLGLGVYLNPPGTFIQPNSISGADALSESYKERYWFADLGVGKEIAGLGPTALQITGGIRVANFVGTWTGSQTSSVTLGFDPNNPLTIGPNTVTSLSGTYATSYKHTDNYLGAGPRIGMIGSVPFAGRWSFDYSGNAAVLFGYETDGNQYTYAYTYSNALYNLRNGYNSASASDQYNQRFATKLSADIQVGIGYWMTPNMKLAASYRLDTLIDVTDTTNANSNSVYTNSPSRYWHGPRLTLTGQFDTP